MEKGRLIRMAKVNIIYWSGTGNTAAMAAAIAEGAKEAGAEAEALDTEDGAEEALPPQPVRVTASTALTAITESFVRFIIKYSFFC